MFTNIRIAVRATPGWFGRITTYCTRKIEGTMPLRLVPVLGHGGYKMEIESTGRFGDA